MAPLVDLRRLVDLVRWSHALEATRTRGDLLATAGLLRKEVADQYRAGEGEPALSKVKDYAEDLSRSLPAGLPLEVGLAARQLIDAEARLAAQGASLPHQAARALAGQIQKLATLPGIKTKADVRLDAVELRRQLDLSRWYLARHNLPAAALLLREWTVSWAVLDAGQEDLWLDSDTRYAAERSLGASALRSREKRGSEEEQQVGRLWNEITGPRNALAHAGMAGDNFDKRPEDLIRLPDDFAGLLARPPGVLGRRQIPRLLLTPLGNSRGVLYSALKRTTPKFVVVVTSSEARLSLHEAAGHAGVALVGAGEEAAGRIPHIVVELRDPHGGIAELPAVLRDKALCDVLAEATMVEMNITGGTTLMQALVERLAKYAARRGAVVRPFVLPDRRTLEEQRASPFVAAERVDLDLSGSAE